MLGYHIVRSNRKTISIQITPQGEVVVRCPKWMTDSQIDSHVHSRRNWIETHLAKHSRQPVLPPFTAEEMRELADQAKRIIPPRVEFYARQTGVSYGRITIRSQHTRWGSCSGKGNLNFNCLLVLAPTEVLDYVVVHELCHRKEMNHSARFWAEVAKILPGWSAQREWLRQNGKTLLARLPE